MSDVEPTRLQQLATTATTLAADLNDLVGVLHSLQLLADDWQSIAEHKDEFKYFAQELQETLGEGWH